MFCQKKSIVVALAALAGLLASATTHAVLIESVTNAGDILSVTTWNGGVLPGPGDTAVINGEQVRTTGGLVVFNADLLRIDSGSLRNSGTPLQVNNLHLNGGKVIGFGNNSTRLSVVGTLTLDGGVLESRNQNNRTLKIDAASVVGTGFITINTEGNFLGNSIDIDSPDMTGFTGTFVVDGGINNSEAFDIIQDIDAANASFGLEMVQSLFRLTGDVAVTSLIVDGDPELAVGVYDFSTLSGLGYADFFTDEGGTITVAAGSNGVPEPTTALLSLIGIAGLAARRRRHAAAA